MFLALGAVVGGIVVGIVIWQLAFTIHGERIVEAVAVLSSLCAVLAGVDFRGSRWRVPRGWGRRFGRLPYITLFGAALGTGVITAAPSASVIAFVCVAATSQTITWSIAAFVVFATVRAAAVAYAVGGDVDIARLDAPIAAAQVVEPLVLGALLVWAAGL